MVSTDITASFKELLSGKRSLTPPSSARSRSPTPVSRKGKGKQVDEDEEFLREAYRIHAHLTSLTTLINTVRKPYLSTQPAPRSRQPRPLVDSAGDDGDELKRWEGTKYLSDRERDEIDLRVKIILRRCRERVGLLEEGEKARQKVVNPPATSALYTLLPSLAPTDTRTLIEPLITAHRASVIWTLTDLLARISGDMGLLQEERMKRREERSKTLGGMASREAALFASKQSTKASSSKAGLGGTDIGKIVPEGEGAIENQLTPEQIQQFSSENNVLLEQMESKLSSVLSAERSLLEISSLQTELVRHLASQTEITDRLYDEAVGSVGEVGKANEQLKKARQRGEEGRLFLLIFLVGASFALLFLDWYS